MQQEPYHPSTKTDAPTAYTINNVYPWGRSFDEYCQMFRLSADDLHRRILGCADGPAAFNAAMNRRGQRVVSFDPLYHFEATQIRERIDATCSEIIARTTRDQTRFVWNVIRSPEMLAQIRMAAMNDFLSDYEEGRRSGRYVAEALPRLSFADDAFDLALCSHFLFLYSDEVSEEDHVHAIAELCRVAREVRLFPLLDMNGRRSRHIPRIVEEAKQRGLHASVEQVDYEFQRGANEMMRIMRPATTPA